MPQNGWMMVCVCGEKLRTSRMTRMAARVPMLLGHGTAPRSGRTSGLARPVGMRTSFEKAKRWLYPARARLVVFGGVRQTILCHSKAMFSAAATRSTCPPLEIHRPSCRMSVWKKQHSPSGAAACNDRRMACANHASHVSNGTPSSLTSGMLASTEQPGCCGCWRSHVKASPCTTVRCTAAGAAPSGRCGFWGTSGGGLCADM